MFVRSLWLLTLTTLLAPPAFSATSSDWVEIERTEEKAILLDAESIKYSNASSTERQAWVKLVQLRDGDLPKGDYTLSFNEFNCVSGAVKFNEILQFSSSGTLRSKTNLSADGWQRVPSESNYAYIIETACSYPEPKRFASANSASQSADFKGNVLNALQKDMSIGGAVVTSVRDVTKESPTEFSADFVWTVEGKTYNCSGSIETDPAGQVLQASIPYACYRQHIDQ